MGVEFSCPTLILLLAPSVPVRWNREDSAAVAVDGSADSKGAPTPAAASLRVSRRLKGLFTEQPPGFGSLRVVAPHLPQGSWGCQGSPPLPRWDGSSRLLFPLAHGDYDEHLGSLREVVDVRHAAGGVTGKRLQLILMGRDDHDMWTHVEVLVWSLGWRSLVRYPGTRVHVCDANPVDVVRSPCWAIHSRMYGEQCGNSMPSTSQL